MCKNNEKGSALITIILVVLVLTMVGVASLFFMTTEERITNAARMEKAAFYAAETGLRIGEESIRRQFEANGNFLNLALQTPQTTINMLEVPGGGYDAIILTDPMYLEHNDDALAIIDPASPDIAVPATFLRGIRVNPNSEPIATCSVYVRNNEDDPTLNPFVNGDNKINIVSVGIVVTPMGQQVRKVLEEQIAPGVGGGIGSGMKGLNLSGTGSVGVS
ncbi:MAG: PilX N-terminal domain-containing pilus assembly protein [Acidobacteriota bacterium]